MGAVGAMAPTNFQKDTIGTHEISKSMYIATSYFFDCHPQSFLVTIEWHPCSPIPNAPSESLILLQIATKLGMIRSEYRE